MLPIVKLPSDKVNFTWSTDWHLSGRPPGRRTDDYQQAILKKLDFICDLTTKINGVALCGGDVFHVKNIKSPSNSLSLFIPTIHTLRRFPTGGVYGSVGNHDLSWDRMDSLPNQPLGLLIATKVYRNLNESPVIFTNESETIKVMVETFPYDRGHETLARILNAAPRPADVNYRVGIVHAYSQPGDEGSMFGEPKIGYNQTKDTDFDFLLWGHDHSRKETETVGNVTHVHLGSLARAAFDTDEVDRPVACAILSFSEEGIRFKEKNIPVQPLEIAFTVADKAMEKIASSEEVKEFFAEMDEQVDGIEATDPREILRSLCPDDVQLLSLIQELCEF